jgi:hypothetical protein
MIGALPPREGLQLYEARVDPHLTSGCEVVLDTEVYLVAHLEKLLDLNLRCMLPVLFTETGILPMQ